MGLNTAINFLYPKLRDCEEVSEAWPPRSDRHKKHCSVIITKYMSVKDNAVFKIQSKLSCKYSKSNKSCGLNVIYVILNE